jgi:hypothetical protein
LSGDSCRLAHRSACRPLHGLYSMFRLAGRTDAQNSRPIAPRRLSKSRKKNTKQLITVCTSIRKLLSAVKSTLLYAVPALNFVRRWHLPSLSPRKAAGSTFAAARTPKDSARCKRLLLSLWVPYPYKRYLRCIFLRVSTVFFVSAAPLAKKKKTTKPILT